MKPSASAIARAPRRKPLKVRDLSKSEDLWRRAQPLIPAGTQTLSKGPTQFVDGVAPKYLARGKGCRVWDVDGNEYIDYPMGLGPVILGHAYPAVNAAIERQLQEGFSFSMMHPLEVEVAEMLRDLVPCAEMVRFGKNGSDATTGAVRVARAHTGRDLVAHCGYHGWHDWYVASTTRDKGVPESAKRQQVAFRYNDLDSLALLFERHPDQIACVIMEPVVAADPRPGYLEGVARLARLHGAVLIFDEVASGFRYHLGGVHQRFGVQPDLACFGKAMANGMPISALVGKAEFMRELDEAFYSFTFGGECLSLAAAKATILEMQSKQVIRHLWSVGRPLLEGYNRLAREHGLTDVTQAIGMAPRPLATFKASAATPDLAVKSLFQQEALKRGILFTGMHCMTYSHKSFDVNETLEAYESAFEFLAAALQEKEPAKRLEGRPVLPVFRPLG